MILDFNEPLDGDELPGTFVIRILFVSLPLLLVILLIGWIKGRITK
jgi:hypothetical protein